MAETKDILSNRRYGHWTAFLLLFYLLRNIPNLLSEYWYDEVLTITNFALDPRQKGLWNAVFRSYPIANNHILNSAISYFFLRLFPIASEPLQRLPSLFFGACAILIVLCVWRKVLGDKMALLGGTLLAVSPVVNAYVWQLRGYSLTLLLSTLAMTGVLFAKAKPRGSLLLSSVSCLLLPLVIPSNAMVAPVIAVAFVVQMQGWRKQLLPLLCIGGATAVGLAYYLTIWPQFIHAMQEPDGYSSAWKVAFALLLGLAVHLLPLAIPFYSRPAIDRNDRRICGTIFGGSLLICLFLLLVSRHGHSPYPRVFLVLFPPITAGIMLVFRNSCFSLFHGTAFALVAGLLITLGCDTFTKHQLKKGIVPDNLLCQYYQGSTELREIAFFLSENYPKESLLLTDAYDFPTMQFYWAITGHEGKNVLAINRVPEIQENHSSIAIISRTTEDLQLVSMVTELDTTKAVPLKTFPIRTIYTIE